MQITPELHVVLSDRAGFEAQQAGHAAAIGMWRGAGEGAALCEAFAAFAAGQALHALPPLAALFDGSDSARRMVTGLVEALLPALRDGPFGQVPLRHHVSRASTTLLVAREGNASLTLVAIDGAALASQQPATSAPFSPAEEWDVVVSGHGSARLVERHGAPGHAVHPLALEPGLALGRDAAREALLIDRADPSLLLLRLQRRRGGPTPVREFDLASGALIHQSAASPRDSRHEIAVAVLGRMARTDAAPVLAEIAADDHCGDMLRWQALRECLALDTLTGFRSLSALATREGDSLAAAAGALRARLIEQHPVLAEIQPCPA